MDNGASAGRTTERTDREWLSWALQFAQANLKSWQEQDWRNALAEAMAFGASHDESAHATTADHVGTSEEPQAVARADRDRPPIGAEGAPSVHRGPRAEYPRAPHER